jgi:hypothetical protein
MPGTALAIASIIISIVAAATSATASGVNTHNAELEQGEMANKSAAERAQIMSRKNDLSSGKAMVDSRSAAIERSSGVAERKGALAAAGAQARSFNDVVGKSMPTADELYDRQSTEMQNKSYLWR